MNTDLIKGIVVPILTPIDENEMVNEAKMRKQVDFVIEGGVSGILAFGSNGEFYMLEEEEILSNSVYYYDADKKELEVAAYGEN